MLRSFSLNESPWLRISDFNCRTIARPIYIYIGSNAIECIYIYMYNIYIYIICIHIYIYIHSMALLPRTGEQVGDGRLFNYKAQTVLFFWTSLQEPR